MPDFIIEDCGSVVMIQPITEAAQEFVDENVEVPSYAWMGKRFACDHRPGWVLVSDLEGYGFELEHAT